MFKSETRRISPSKVITSRSGIYYAKQRSFLIVTQNTPKNTNTTLYRELVRLADNYPLPDVIENLASIAFERKLVRTSELLYQAVDVVLPEVS
jgi:hypothetical protein